ncbi:hypothetical protein U1Q18_015363 [Sarracenia purpurea var. burkii]
MSLFVFIFLVSDLRCSVTTARESKQKKLAYHPLCPLNFDTLREMVKSGPNHVNFLDIQSECRLIVAGIRVVRSAHLRTTGNFSLSPTTSEACWESVQVLVNEHLEGFDVRSSCGFQTCWISNSCFKITTQSEFEALVPEPELRRLISSCNHSLGINSSACESCRASLLSIQEAHFRGREPGNSSDCVGYPYLYAAAFGNQFGPTDFGTAKCLFKLDLASFSPTTKKNGLVIGAIAIGCAIGSFGAGSVAWFCRRQSKNSRKRKDSSYRIVTGLELGSGLGFLGETTSLVKFTLEEMSEASLNFSRGNLLGKGRYGNVYRGKLANGSEVALKRFKNCSVSGDENFRHEVEVIASVKHVNIVALRGYCTETDALGSHQRIIVCDLMPNGSLHDHLFGPGTTKLSWPIRKKIALGTARGLAYLHSGAQPVVIHRDVKASNILLDEMFEPKLADFGLAKFTPDGLSHLSTKVAGTLGYVAPEYALYGQLTERSDVYSFGVVLLELLSGKQAVLLVENGGGPRLLTDWAWSLVQKGQGLEVVEGGMLGIEPPEVMEKYVLIGVISAHPLLHARPTMEQIVTMLDRDDNLVPAAMVTGSIPGWPISLITEGNDIERPIPFHQHEIGPIYGKDHSHLEQIEEEESLLFTSTCGRIE